MTIAPVPGNDIWSKLEQLGSNMSQFAPISTPQNDLMGKVFALNPDFGQQLYGARDNAARTQQYQRSIDLQQVVAQREQERIDALKKLAASGAGLDELIKQGSIITGDIGPLAELAAAREKQQAEEQRRSALAQAIFGGSAPTPSAGGNAPLNVRNNNPGNLRPKGASSGFQAFSTPEEGMAAMANDLTAKITGNSPAMKARFGEGYQPTLANVIETWAPPEENDTAGYVDFVAQKTGIAPDKVLSPMDIQKIMPAMIEMEGGKPAVEAFMGGTTGPVEPIAEASPQVQPVSANPALESLKALAAMDPEQFGDEYLAALVDEQKAVKEAEKTSKEDKVTATKGEADLRKEFEGLPDVKQFREVEASYKRINKAATKNSAAGDIALIFNYMKMLDPGSTVREGEFATAQNAAGIPTQVWNMYNKAVSGERLAPEQRADFLNQAKEQYFGAEELFNVRADQYQDLAKEYDYNPKRIVTRARQKVEADKPAQSAKLEALEGRTATGPNGQKVIMRGGKWQPI